uniref:Pentatricopeptide repeat-containing protein At4g21300 n=1 Tax=Tanacetum cinerariifolium TaxID=118510 RepID=A0A6L2NMT5_TANCI|nr:pentatricopeptide repeat-containing protein At4g21300 [Tanacetum cinerariifolium]
MDMYAKCGRLDYAHEVFVKMSEKDSVCWNSMITSFCQNGQPGKAIDLFREMGLERVKYDSSFLVRGFRSLRDAKGALFGGLLNCLLLN